MPVSSSAAIVGGSAGFMGFSLCGMPINLHEVRKNVPINCRRIMQFTGDRIHQNCFWNGYAHRIGRMGSCSGGVSGSHVPCIQTAGHAVSVVPLMMARPSGNRVIS